MSLRFGFILLFVMDEDVHNQQNNQEPDTKVQKEGAKLKQRENTKYTMHRERMLSVVCPMSYTHNTQHTTQTRARACALRE